MPARRPKTAKELVIRSQLALGLNYRGLAELLGSSLRTVQRWGAGASEPTPLQLAALARHVHPKDPALAGELAAEAARVLTIVGVTVPAGAFAMPPSPAAPAQPPPAPAQPSARRPPPAHFVEIIVYAAAEAMDLSPRAVLPAVRAAFARARQLAVDVAAVDDALAPAPAKRTTAK